MDWCTLGRPGTQKTGYRQSCRERKGLGRRYFWALTFILLFLIVFFLAGQAWAKKKVVLVVDGKEAEVLTSARTVGELLQEEGVAFSGCDRVDPPAGTPLTNNMRVVLKHAVRVSLTVNGETKEVLTCQDTVADFLFEQGISLSSQDIVEPDPGGRLEEGEKIRVVRVRTAEEVKEVPIPYSTRRETDGDLERGFSRVVQEGKDGLEKQRWLVVYHDNQEVERSLVECSVVKKPVERVVFEGARQQVSRGGENIRFSRALEMVATAYTFTGHNTASGVPPRFGVVAVDPQVIPLGTQLYVEGYGYARALDVGPAITGNRIDVFLNSADEARHWGVRRVKVYILE
ncbi:MAG: ubiquitin-like domain-containing protein [Desulfotomaculales bacterium]